MTAYGMGHRLMDPTRHPSRRPRHDDGNAEAGRTPHSASRPDVAGTKLSLTAQVPTVREGLSIDNDEVVRLEIYVHPGATRATVGGMYGGALIVRVSEPADDGRATTAALHAVADALKLPKRSVSLVRGAKSRRKLIDITTDLRDTESLRMAVQQLLDGPES